MATTSEPPDNGPAEALEARAHHRGPAPQDLVLFGAAARPALREAVADLSWLWGRGYAETSALKLVGDRYRLTERQRMAVRRSSCADAARQRRLRHQVPLADLRGRPLLLDGFNVLLTLETALGGGVILGGRDGCYRDLAGIHGTYRRVAETVPGLEQVGEYLVCWGVGPCTWLLDQPISNSGRVRALIAELAESRGWDWRAEVVMSPDAVLAEAPEAVATADAAILDRCAGWANLARAVIEARVPTALVVDLGDTGAGREAESGPDPGRR
ncbi:MAG TPA: DUF434 domain-containing protein [Isosphaeraceae bacterium]|jgi:hypothetical protein